jgi:hypothetical protein
MYLVNGIASTSPYRAATFLPLKATWQCMFTDK